MTDQTKCPHCGAALKCHWSDKDLFNCGTITVSGVTLTRDAYCYDSELHRAKGLMKEAAEALRMLKHWAAIYSEYNHETLNACIDNAAEVLSKLDAQQETVR